MGELLKSVNEHSLTLLGLLIGAFITGVMVPWYFLSSVPRNPKAVLEVVKEDISSVTIKDKKSDKQFMVIKDGSSLKVIELPSESK